MQKLSFNLLAVLLAASMAVGCAVVSPVVAPVPPPATMTEGLLTDLKGMTLYTFDRDIIHTGKSVCNGDCAKNWPPFFAAEDAKPVGNYAIIKRDDGKAQWAFEGKPLYFWPEDQAPGDKFGNGYRNVWRAIGPAAKIAAGAPVPGMAPAAKPAAKPSAY